MEIMRSNRFVAVLLGVALIVSLAPAAVAHHSVSAEFDLNKPINFKGTVKKVEWGNPHIYTVIETKDAAGKVVTYRVEGGAPNALYRAGWRPDTLKPGDEVTVSGRQAKSPTSNNVGQASITTADGKRVF
jgi:hypothetical protein